MNKKTKNREYGKIPDWLVNLVIRLRVARWRLVERLNRWAANEKPWRVRLYFILFIAAGGAAYCMLLTALRPRHKEWTWAQQKELQTFERHEKWDSLSDDPRVLRDGEFYWRLLDSIRSDSNLRRSIDSLLRARPGLADTLRQVEVEHPRGIKMIWLKLKRIYMLNTTKFSLEQRKLSLLAPVPVVFCLLLLFHGLGGGKGKAPGADSTAVAQGEE